MPTILVSETGGIRTLTLNRPERRNALTPEMQTELIVALDDAAASSSTRVVILTGAGECFCSGLDLTALQAMQHKSPEQLDDDARRIARMFQTLYALPIPTIAQVNGHAIAGGTGLATLCDFTLAAMPAKFGYTEVRIGFVPALVSAYLVMQIGEKRARDLLLTGRLFSAEEAHGLGLVTEVVAPEALSARVESLSATQQYNLLDAMPRGKRQALYTVASPQLRRRIQLLQGGPQQVVNSDLAEGKLFRAVYSNRQLEEVLTDFWYNHFNVFLDKGADRYMVTTYERDVIRPHVFGNFKDLLLATAQSPAMLFYLDNSQSVAPGTDRKPNGKKPSRGLNENYGRELMELHTLGVDGGYTQQDVTEVARCFTGWTIKELRGGGVFQFNERVHDQGEKTVLGVKIPANGGINDGLKVIDILVHHPATAQFVSKSLVIRFVSDNPPASLINRMAATLTRTEGDLRATMKTMFDSPEFYAPASYQTKIKSPFEMMASALRLTGAEVDYGFNLIQQLNTLGEPLYRKVEPTGYSNKGSDWLNSASLLARMNFAVALSSNKVPGTKVEAKPEIAQMLGGPNFQKH